MNLAALRSALLQNKLVMRFGCCLVAVSVLMSCWVTPRAKAVVLDGAMFGSVFGSVLASMGYSWAAQNMDSEAYGNAMYQLIQDCDTETGSNIHALLDAGLAGLSAVGQGKLHFNAKWVSSANTFAEWIHGKYFSSGNTSALIFGNVHFMNYSDDRITVDFPNVITVKQSQLATFGYDIAITSPVQFYLYIAKSYTVTDDYYFLQKLTLKVGGQQQFISEYSTTDDYYIYQYDITQEMVDSGCILGVTFKGNWHSANDVIPISVVNYINYDGIYSLTAEKVAEIHYPTVSEEGQQVYEIVVDGVTATDIEGIIQGAVDQILAGTAAIVGTVTEAQDVPVTPEEPPELDGLGLPALGAALTTRFPFSIPWDVARGIKMLAAPAEAPYWEVDFLEPISYRVGGWQGSTTIVLDFSDYEIIGQVTRWMSTIGFCLMLAASTKRLIWVA